jgi:membrane protein DedA with SNARE-associated domain
MSATDSWQFLEHYGVFILPALAVAEQLGIPLPAVPALLAVGALAADGRISIPLVLGAMSVAALVTDFAWYELGRRRGAWLLARFRRMSPEPDTCVRRAESIFGRHGARGMLAAKFLPGLTTLMPPLAGVFGVSRVRFALYDLAGVLLWAGTWLALGYCFSDAIVLIAARVTELGRLLGFVLVTALAAYFVIRYWRRHLDRRLRIPAAERGVEMVAVHARDDAEADALGAHRLAFPVKRAPSEAFTVRGGHHGLSAPRALRLALRQEPQVSELGAHEQRGGAIGAGGHAGAAPDALGGVQRALGGLAAHRDRIGLGGAAGAHGDIAARLHYPVQRAPVHDQVAHEGEGAGAEGLQRDGSAVAERTHREQAGGGPR